MRTHARLLACLLACIVEPSLPPSSPRFALAHVLFLEDPQSMHVTVLRMARYVSFREFQVGGQEPGRLQCML